MDEVRPGNRRPVGGLVSRPDEAIGAKIDLTRLEDLNGGESEMLARYLRMIQVQRQDFNGRVLTIRRDDLRAIACILDTPPDHATERLEQLGMLFQGAPALTTIPR